MGLDADNSDVHFSAETVERMQHVVLTYVIKRASYVSGLRSLQISQLQFARFCNDHARMLGSVMPLMDLHALRAFKMVVERMEFGIEDNAEREALEELLGCLIGLREIAQRGK